jgi:hypothetical protein
MENKKVYRCKDCGNEELRITNIYCCGLCENNGVYNEETGEYEYLEILADDQERTEMEDTGSCDIYDGEANGCWIIECTKCNKIIDNVPCITD